MKLLRVLQERAFERVGGEKLWNRRHSRLIAASNRDLSLKLTATNFARTCSTGSTLCPWYCRRYASAPRRRARFGGPFRCQSRGEARSRHAAVERPELIDSFQEYDWPGNARELENLMERLVLLDRQRNARARISSGKILKALPAPGVSSEATFEGAVARFKRELIIEALQAEDENIAAAAKRPWMSRSFLYKLISDFGL